MSQPIFAIDWDQVANVGMRTKHRATFPVRFLDDATDPALRHCAFVLKHLRHHHDQDNLPLYDREVRHWLRAVRFTVQPHINVGGVEVAVGMRADLRDALLLPAGPKQLQVRENGLIPEFFDFQFGTCVGSLRPGPTAYELLAVINEAPGNGDFGQLMLHLARLATAHQRDIIVLEIHAAYLYQHLQKHGYQPVGTTRHLFLPVAGPGVCPPEFLVSIQNEALDKLLTRVLALASPPSPRTYSNPRNKREAA